LLLIVVLLIVAVFSVVLVATVIWLALPCLIGIILFYVVLEKTNSFLQAVAAAAGVTYLGVKIMGQLSGTA
jgi:hypothetical protein